MNNLLSSYKKTGLYSKVLGESPHGLVSILLSTLCQNIFQNGQILKKIKKEESAKVRTKLVRKAATLQDNIKKITQHLSFSLKNSYDKQLAKYLLGLYSHIDYQVFLSAKQMEEKPSEQALKVAEEILSMWQAIPKEVHNLSGSAMRE